MDTQLRMMQKFSNFWSNVSNIRIPNPDNVSQETIEAIIYGTKSVQAKDKEPLNSGYGP